MEAWGDSYGGAIDLAAWHEGVALSSQHCVRTNGDCVVLQFHPVRYRILQLVSPIALSKCYSSVSGKEDFVVRVSWVGYQRAALAKS